MSNDVEAWWQLHTYVMRGYEEPIDVQEYRRGDETLDLNETADYLNALQAQADLAAGLRERVAELEHDAEFDDQAIHRHIAQLAELGAEAAGLRAAAQNLLDSEARLEAQVAIPSAIRGRKAALEKLRALLSSPRLSEGKSA